MGVTSNRPAWFVLVGVAPAVAKAIFHVTGRRVRPITADALL
jgi:CO/xanthine dehydrogenase Mo-binding subunit